MANDDALKFEIVNQLGGISEGKSGWTYEFNLVSWTGAEPKYDIRKWQKHTRIGKGVTLTENELRKLKELIDNDIEYLDSDTML